MLRFAAVLALTSALLSGCGGDNLNATEKKIAGTWKTVVTMDNLSEEPDVDTSLVMDREAVYSKNRTMSEKGELKVKFSIDRDDGTTKFVTLVYELSDKGTWSADGDTLVETLNSPEIVFRSSSVRPREPGDKDVIETIRELFEDGFRAELFKDIGEPVEYEISELTGSKLVVVDKEVGEVTYRRP